MTGSVTTSQRILDNLEVAKNQKTNLEEAVENLKVYNQRLGDEIQSKNKEIERLLERIKVIKSAKSLAESGGGSADVKYKINEMVREIDRCISYLNK